MKRQARRSGFEALRYSSAEKPRQRKESSDGGIKSKHRLIMFTFVTRTSSWQSEFQEISDKFERRKALPKNRPSNVQRIFHQVHPLRVCHHQRFQEGKIRLHVLPGEIGFGIAAPIFFQHLKRSISLCERIWRMRRRRSTIL